MRIRINSTVLAPGGDASPTGLQVAGQEVVEETRFFRALAETFWARGNRSSTITFSVGRSHGSIRMAERFLLTHYSQLPSSGDVVFSLGEGADSEEVALLGAVLEAVPDLTHRGTYTRTTYTLRGGVLTTDTIPTEEDIDVTPIRRGTVAIDSDAMEVEVAYLNPMDGVPTVTATILMPTEGGDAIWATVQADTITDEGFTATLSGPPSGSGYKLSYIAIL